MTDSKQILLRKKKLRAWANALVNHELFDELMVHARAHLMETVSIPVEQQRGIAAFITALKDVTEEEDGSEATMQSGLIQDLNPEHAKQIRTAIEKTEQEAQEKVKG